MEEIKKKITSVDFPEYEYVKEKTQKKTFIIHHSAGWDNARGMFKQWVQDIRGKVATAYGITDDGCIYSGFDASLYYAYAIYVHNPSNLLPERMKDVKTKLQDILLNKQAIQCEICNWGYLTEKAGRFYAWANAEVPPEKVQYYPEPWRGHNFYEKYTAKEIQSLEELILYHAVKDNIPVKYNPDMWEISERAIRGAEGIWSHSSYRTDKSDAHPQPELIKMLEGLEEKLRILKMSNKYEK